MNEIRIAERLVSRWGIDHIFRFTEKELDGARTYGWESGAFYLLGVLSRRVLGWSS